MTMRAVETQQRALGEPEPLFRFVVPLRLAPGDNTRERMNRWKRAKGKLELAERMLGQLARQGKLTMGPLQGCPTVSLTRYSSKQPDYDDNWMKWCIDSLKVPKRNEPGLGLLRDDAPGCYRLLTGWKYAATGKGRVEIEIWPE